LEKKNCPILIIEEQARADGSMNAHSLGKMGARNRIKKTFYFIFGTVFLVLGGVGVLLPILPTTPFLLLSAACYYRSSERMHNWMFTNKWFGTYLKNYAEGKGISKQAKIFTISALWILISYSVFFAVDNPLAQLALILIAIGVTIHLVKIPTFVEG